jgi:hypothetical protein
MQLRTIRAARDTPVMLSIGKSGSFSTVEFDEVSDLSGHDGRKDDAGQVDGAV